MDKIFIMTSGNARNRKKNGGETLAYPHLMIKKDNKRKYIKALIQAH